MEVGQSFFVELDALDGALERNIRAYSCTAGNRLGRKFSAAKVDGGIRVWRVA